VNARNEYGDTPLHYAAEHGHLDVALLLIERGADVNSRNNEGKTPLDVAREEGHVEVARVIEEHSRGRTGG